MDRQNCGRRAGRSETCQHEKPPSINRSSIDPVSGKGLHDQARQSHEGESRSDGALGPASSHQIDSLEDIETISELTQTQRDEHEREPRGDHFARGGGGRGC
mmetsp:Transcript_54792/g.61245  ORF Transcript_54792/g.61245 Transcript_54792/m.61245 type:complete len:102 (-) Transcript_54792:125-430(-)